jgi:tetratricopeptide (TPR) repeat protein
MAGERQHALAPLPVPAEATVNWLTPALRLLLAEAGRAVPGFDATPHREPLCALARALGGLPLALKLVGRWLALLTPQEVLNAVHDDPVAFDPAGRFGQALALGWQQLGRAPQQTLLAISVHAGDVAFDDLEGPAAERVTMLERLALLGWIERAVATGPPAAAGTQWRLHPLVRAWLARQRTAQPERDAQARAQHAQAQHRALARWADWRRVDQGAALADLRRRWPDLRLLWADGLAALDGNGLRLLALPLTRLFEFDGRVREGHTLFAAAGRQLEAAGAALAGARAACARAAALLLYRDSRYAEAEREASLGLELAETLQDREDIKGCLNTRALSRWMQARLPEALQDAERACAMAREEGDRSALAVLTSTLGLIHKRRGAWAEAEAVFSECLALHRETGNRISEMVTLGNLGNLCLVQGRVPEAQAAYEQQLAIAEREGWRSQRTFALANLAKARLAAGDPVAADVLIERAWQETSAAGEPMLLGHLALFRAQSAMQRGRLADAAASLAQGLRLSLALAGPVVLLEGLALHARWCLACGDAATARVSHGLASADDRLHAELRVELDADRARHPTLALAGPAGPWPDLRAWVEQQCAALQAAAGERQIPWPVEAFTALGGAQAAG